VDTPTRDQMVAEDPATTDLMRPLLRGQDVERWASDWAGQWIIVLKSSGDHPWPWAASSDPSAAEAKFQQAYPALHRRMAGFRPQLKAREDQGRFWWELRSCAYYEAFTSGKIVYQEIQFYPCYALDNLATLLNNTTFFY